MLLLPLFAAHSRLLLVCNLDALPQTFNDKGLAGGALVNVPDVVGGALEVAGGVVALGDEDVVLGAVVGGLVDGNGSALWSVSLAVESEVWRGLGQLTMNCSSILPRRSRPGCSSRWWLAADSAIVETMATQ